MSNLPLNEAAYVSMILRCTMLLWYYGTVLLWYFGTMVVEQCALSYYGITVLWYSATMVIWYYGIMIQ